MTDIQTSESEQFNVMDKSTPAEASKLVELSWGTWRLRYALGLALALVSFGVLQIGTLTGNTSASFPQTVLYPIQWVLVAAAFVVLPASSLNRIFGVALVGVVVGLQSWLLPLVFSSQSVYRSWAVPVTSIALGILATAAWLTIRHRSAWAYAAILPVSAILTLVLPTFTPGLYRSTYERFGPQASAAVALVVVLTSWAIKAWGAWAVDLAVRISKQRRQNRALAPAVPRQMATASIESGAQTGTNTLAIASFVSVWFVSVAGVVMGHMALSQIKQTGQSGRGLALAAVIIGWISIGVAIVMIIVFLIATTAMKSSGY